MVNPKHPENLATFFEVNSDSVGLDRDKESHIMSVSKTFCGATAALMAADGKFGDNKINASLAEILDEARKAAANRYQQVEEDPNETIENLAKAKKDYSQRIDTITEYEDMIAAKDCGDVTMSELLSHRSGFIAGDGYLKPGNLSNIDIFRSDELFEFDRSKKDDHTWSYCNPAFVLAEDLMSLVSDSPEGYYGELKDRVIKPLGLDHTKSVYESEEAVALASDTVVIKGVVYDYGVESEKTERSNFLNDSQKGKLALSEGGLCSSVNDIEKFYEEVAKMACGIPSALVSSPEKVEEIHGFYLEAYKQGENSKADTDLKGHVHCASNYSLGVITEAVDDQGNPVTSRGNEDKRIGFRGLGGSKGGFASGSATMPFSVAEFTSSAGQLQEGEMLESHAAISQSDVLVRNSLLAVVACDYIDRIDDYFSNKCDKETDTSYNDMWQGVNWRKYNQYWEAARSDEGYVATKWQGELIEQHRLPTNFAEFHEEIFEAYQPARQALREHIIENYLDDEGVINREKIANDFQTAEDFDRLKQEVLGEHLEYAHQQTKEILSRADQQLALESKSEVKDILNGVVDQVEKSFVERFAGDRQEESLSWRDRVSSGNSSDNTPSLP